MASSSSSSSQAIEVPVVWNFQNNWVTENYNLPSLKTKIEAALKTYNKNFVVKGKITAVGYAQGEKFEAIKQLSSDFEVEPIPLFNIRCGGENCDVMVQRNPNSNHELIMRNTNMVEKYMIKEIYPKFLEADYVLVIGGDQEDLMDTYFSVKILNKNVMLAEEQVASDLAKMCAKAIWKWGDMMNGEGPSFVN